MPRGYRVSTCRSRGSGELRSASEDGVGDIRSEIVRKKIYMKIMTGEEINYE